MRTISITLENGRKVKVSVGRTYLMELVEHYPAVDESIFKSTITDHEIYILKVFDNPESNSFIAYSFQTGGEILVSGKELLNLEPVNSKLDYREVALEQFGELLDFGSHSERLYNFGLVMNDTIDNVCEKWAQHLPFEVCSLWVNDLVKIKFGQLKRETIEPTYAFEFTTKCYVNPLYMPTFEKMEQLPFGKKVGSMETFFGEKYDDYIVDKDSTSIAMDYFHMRTSEWEEDITNLRLCVQKLNEDCLGINALLPESVMKYNWRIHIFYIELVVTIECTRQAKKSQIKTLVYEILKTLEELGERYSNEKDSTRFNESELPF